MTLDDWLDKALLALPKDLKEITYKLDEIQKLGSCVTILLKLVT